MNRVGKAIVRGENGGSIEAYVVPMDPEPSSG
jgi:hypothetical protein